MTGKERFEAAFSNDGASDIPVAICYQMLFVRDHWKEFHCPWWYSDSPDIEQQISYCREVISAMGDDWFRFRQCKPKIERNGLIIESCADGIYQKCANSKIKTRLKEPAIGGDVGPIKTPPLPETKEDIDKVIPLPVNFSASLVREDGRADLALGLVQEYGKVLAGVYYSHSPLWHCYCFWGFDGLMNMIALSPDLVQYACHRILLLEQRTIEEAALMGVDMIWIEECMTDMISPAAFRELNLPYMCQLVDTIRSLRMKSIYYYCGSPAQKLDLILAAGADAIALEESKKDFFNDIEKIVEFVNGRCAVFGNLDAIGVLQDGSEEQLRNEIKRQISAGRKNKSRFIMGLGSPVTPATPVRRVHQFCELVHEIGK